MTDFKPSKISAPAEPALTKLVSSSNVKAPNIETWQMHNFDEETAPSAPETSEEALEEAEDALQPELQKQAELLKKEAYDQAYQEGYQAGLVKGVEDGMVQGAAEGLEKQTLALTPKLLQFEQLLEMLQAPYQKVEQQVLADLVALSLHVAKQVVKTELSQDTDWILKAVQEAVQLLPEALEATSEAIRVELHPEDLQLLQELKPELTEQWQLKANSELVLGTCLIKQKNSSVLNSWQQRFDEISTDLHARTIPSKISEP